MSTINPLVCIVVLNWRSFANTSKCLESLAEITYKNYRVLVVDNGSNDGSIEMLKSIYPAHTYILSGENVGFSCGCNLGIRHALSCGAQYVLLLNNDTTVEPSFLEPAVDIFSEYTNVGAVTGKIMYSNPKNMIWQAGGHIDLYRAQGIARGMNEEDIGKYDEICDTGWASGAMSLISRATLEKVGLLPEEYFFGQEEWDYSTAILRNHLRIIYVPQFKSYHSAGGSYRAQHPILNIYGGYINKMIYARKYLPSSLWIPWKCVFWLYLRLYWPRLARKYAETAGDHAVLVKAAHLAFVDHAHLTRVTRRDLEIAAIKLNVDSSWR
jgi:GT2 family glycosyltransferase